MGQRRKCDTSAAAAPLVQDGLLRLGRPVQQQRQVPQLDLHPKQLKFAIAEFFQVAHAGNLVSSAL